jgi:hypothetical protein
MTCLRGKVIVKMAADRITLRVPDEDPELRAEHTVLIDLGHRMKDHAWHVLEFGSARLK